MTPSRPPRVAKPVTPSSRHAPPLETDQLLVAAVALLLLQDGASMLLVLALLYIAM